MTASSQKSPFLPHLPTEIWESILSEVIYVPLFFDGVCPDGINFIDFLQHRNNFSDYAKSEAKRHRLRLVCTSWKAWTDSMALRHLELGPDDGPIPEYSRARKVVYSPPLQICLSSTTQWEILHFVFHPPSAVESALDQLITNFSLHPKLCALEIRMMLFEKLGALFFAQLPLLVRLTSLRIHVNPTKQPYKGPMIYLPTLQLLDVVEIEVGLPFSSMRLPSLRYFAIRTSRWREELDAVLEHSTLLRALHVNLMRSGGPTPRFDYAPRIEELLVGYRNEEWDVEEAGSFRMHQHLKMVIIHCDIFVLRPLKWVIHRNPPQLRVVRMNHHWEKFQLPDLHSVAQCAEQAGVQCEDGDGVEIGEHIRIREAMQYLP
jgi:hypothetical protein